MVYQRGNEWVNKRNDAERASSVHRTQAAATTAATSMLRRQGGGELIVKGEDQRIRSKDTIAPGRESSVKDTEH